VSNEEQQRFIDYVDNGEAGVLLLIGPPGTGKSITIIMAVLQLLSKQPEANVLLVTQSNMAADRLGQILLGVLYDSQLVRPLRVYAKQQQTRPNVLCAAIALHLLLRAELEVPTTITSNNPIIFERVKTGQTELAACRSELLDLVQVKQGKRRYNPSLNDLRTRIKAAQVDLNNNLATAEAVFRDAIRPNVVIATIGSLLDHHVLIRERYSVVIIDEASQVNIPASFLALSQMAFTSSSGRRPMVVLVGDPAQLPPMVVARGTIASQLSCSLMEHLFNEHLAPSVKLLQAYRFHPYLMKIPNALTYHGQLRTSVTEDNRQLSISWLPKDKPLVWVQVQDLQERTPGHSWMNKHEARLLCAMVLKGTKEGWLNPENTLIITPYEAQRSLIRNQLELQTEQEWMVTTVDGSQGREASVILLSLVRSQKCPNMPLPLTRESEQERAQISTLVGFLQDDRRNNVALSRARDLMIIFGNANTLSCTSYWHQLVSWCQNQNTIAYPSELGLL